MVENGSNGSRVVREKKDLDGFGEGFCGFSVGGREQRAAIVRNHGSCELTMMTGSER